MSTEVGDSPQKSNLFPLPLDHLTLLVICPETKEAAWSEKEDFFPSLGLNSGQAWESGVTELVNKVTIILFFFLRLIIKVYITRLLVNNMVIWALKDNILSKIENVFYCQLCSEWSSESTFHPRLHLLQRMWFPATANLHSEERIQKANKDHYVQHITFKTTVAKEHKREV